LAQPVHGIAEDPIVACVLFFLKGLDDRSDVDIAGKFCVEIGGLQLAIKNLFQIICRARVMQDRITDEFFLAGQRGKFAVGILALFYELFGLAFGIAKAFLGDDRMVGNDVLDILFWKILKIADTATENCKPNKVGGVDNPQRREDFTIISQVLD
jgi:hypothetical protein